MDEERSKSSTPEERRKAFTIVPKESQQPEPQIEPQSLRREGEVPEHLKLSDADIARRIADTLAQLEAQPSTEEIRPPLHIVSKDKS